MTTHSSFIDGSVAAAPTAANSLAIFGGEKAVSAPYQERWKPVRALDIWRVVKLLRRQVTTIATDEGVIGEFERTFASMCQTRYALAMNSGTATLHSAYFAVGVKPGHEVIVPSYTFFASAAPILQLGARPVFCDIDPDTLTLDPQDVERRITPRTRAICAVHVWGNPARIDLLSEIAKRHGVALIEDCSHAHGARFADKPVGSWGDVGCFSMQGQKAVSGGESGVAVTNDPVLFDRMLALGHNVRTIKGQAADTFDIHGMNFGVKYRPHVLAITLALGSLQRLGQLNEKRARNYEIISQGLEGCEAVRPIGRHPQATRGGFLEFILQFNSQKAGGWNRAAYLKAAQREGIPIQADRYADLLHQCPLFRGVDYSKLGGYLGANWNPAEEDPATLPVAERVGSQLMTMPAFTDVDERYVRAVVAGLRKVATVAASGNLLR